MPSLPESEQVGKVKEGREMRSLEFLASYPIHLQKLANEYFIAEASKTVEGIEKMEIAKEAMIKLAARKISCEAGLRKKVISHMEVEEKAVKEVENYLEREVRKALRQKTANLQGAKPPAKPTEKKPLLDRFIRATGWIAVIGIELFVMTLLVQKAAGPPDNNIFAALSEMILNASLAFGIAGTVCWGMSRFIRAAFRPGRRV